MSDPDHITSQKHENTDPSLSDNGSGRPRILARQLARPLTAEEIDVVAVPGAWWGGAMAGGTCSAGTCCVPDCDD